MQSGFIIQTHPSINTTISILNCRRRQISKSSRNNTNIIDRHVTADCDIDRVAFIPSFDHCCRRPTKSSVWNKLVWIYCLLRSRERHDYWTLPLSIPGRSSDQGKITKKVTAYE